MGCMGKMILRISEGKNMKKKLCIILCGICIIGMTGCSSKSESKSDNNSNDENSENTYVVGEDNSYMFQESSNYVSVVKAENGYYFTINDYVYYTDTTDGEMEYLPVCSMPNCSHDDKSCNAYIGEEGTFSRNIQYYDEHIYYKEYEDIISDTYSICRMSKDGTTKETLFQVAGVRGCPLVHRGYIYIVTAEYDVDKGFSCNHKLMRYNLSDSSYEPEIIDEETGTNCYVDIKLRDNRLYFSVMDDGSSDDGSTDSYWKSKYCELDNIKEIKTVKYPYEINSFNFDIMGDKILCTFYNEDENGEYGKAEKNADVYTCDLNFENYEKVFTLTSPCNSIGTDGIYIYEDNYINPACYREGKEEHKLIIYDMEFNEVDSVVIGDSGAYWNGYGDENYYILIEEGVCYYYFDKSEIGSGNIEVHKIEIPERESMEYTD